MNIVLFLISCTMYFLGYGNPSAARWTNMPDLLEMVDFKGTFLDADHLKDSFPDYQVCYGLPFLLMFYV